MVRSGVLVTPRDRAMLAWIGGHVMTPEQAARRFFARSDGEVGERTADRRLAKLQWMGLERRDAAPLWRSLRVIRLTQAGANAGQVDTAPEHLGRHQSSRGLGHLRRVVRHLLDVGIGRM